MEVGEYHRPLNKTGLIGRYGPSMHALSMAGLRLCHLRETFLEGTTTVQQHSKLCANLCLWVVGVSTLAL